MVETLDRAGIPLAEITPRSGEAQHYVTASGIVDRDGKPPVYVLTSAHTWSGGEGLAYILQEHHRAEIIGETTVGAAGIRKVHRIPLAELLCMSGKRRGELVICLGRK